MIPGRLSKGKNDSWVEKWRGGGGVRYDRGIEWRDVSKMRGERIITVYREWLLADAGRFVAKGRS